MTAHEALGKIRVMLGLEEVESETTIVETETETTNVELAEATLLDGTVVKTEGDFEVGKQLFVVTEDGDVPAPPARHETTDGVILVVDDEGIITEIEEVVVEEETETEENFSDDLINQLVGALQPSLDKIEELSNEVKALKGQFHEFRDEPGSPKIYNNLNDINKDEQSIMSGRMAKILEVRRNKNK
jgi:hypothetical protein